MPLYKSNTSTPVLGQFSLKGKVCLVTGGARGIGLEIVRGMAEAGADVALTYITSTDAPETAAKIARETHQKIEAFQTDVTNRQNIAHTMQKVLKVFGRLDVVVANAGVCRQISSLEYTEETFAKDYSVNVDGVMWTAQAAGQIFKAQGYGNLIITASVSSVLVNIPQPQTSYNSSKAAGCILERI